MENITTNNNTLVCGRAGVNLSGPNWNLITVSNSPVDLNLFSRGGGTVFPLYINRG